MKCSGVSLTYNTSIGWPRCKSVFRPLNYLLPTVRDAGGSKWKHCNDEHFFSGVIDNVRTSWKVGQSTDAYANLSEHTLLLEHQRISLTAIENWMQSRQYLGGDIPIYADFIFYKLIENHQLVFPEILDNLPHIRKQIYNFRRLPGVRNYINSTIYSESINQERRYPVFLVGVYGRRYSHYFLPVFYG